MRFWSLHDNGPGGGPTASTGVDYERARQLQLRLVDLRARGAIGDTVLFLEHHPVVTRGRGLQHDPTRGSDGLRHMPLPSQLPRGVSVVETERGGDLTYHEPGQLVIYPICRLDGTGFGPARDVAAFLRKVEQVLIDQLGEWGVAALARENATGVWVRSGGRLSKVASMGIAVRKWVTFHGLAINSVNSMQGFGWISPCGYSSEVMTRVADVIDRASDLGRVFTEGLGDPSSSRWRRVFEASLARRMAGGRAEIPSIRQLSIAEAEAEVDGMAEAAKVSIARLRTEHLKNAPAAQAAE